MSSKEVEIIPAQNTSKTESPLIETIAREEVAVKKCCLTTKQDIHIACKCCAYTWSFTLNGIECCCLGLSSCCIFMSNAALCCNKTLEQIDCDGR